MAGGSGPAVAVGTINNERVSLLHSVDEDKPLPAWKAIRKEICGGQQRVWAVTLFSVLAASTSLLAGYTLAFPSSALLDLRGLHDNRTFYHNKLMEGLFGVSLCKLTLFSIAYISSFTPSLHQFLIFSLVPGHVPYWCYARWVDCWLVS